MEILILHQKLTEDEINLFQDHIDDFFKIWVELFGEEGLSNYIHLLAAGHISWKNIIAFTCIVNRGGRHSTTPSRHTSITTLNEVGKEVGKELGKNHLYSHLCVIFCVISCGKLVMQTDFLLT